MRRRSAVRRLPGAIRRSPTRLRRLSFWDFMLLWEAQYDLPLAALALRRYGLGRLQRILSHCVANPALDPAPNRRAVAGRLAWIVGASAAYGPWPANCLQRSIVLWWFLRRRGLSGQLIIGVRRRKPEGTLDFHAWIEYEGDVIGDRRDMRQQYAAFDRAIAPRDAVFH